MSKTPENSKTQNLGSFGLFDYLLVLVKHKKMIFLTTLGAALISVLYSLTLPNVYTARTMILPSDDDKGIMGAMLAQMGGLAGMAGGLGGPTKTDLYVTMLKSESVKDPIIDRFKLMEVYGTKFRVDAYKVLDKNAVIAAGKKDGVLTVSIADKDPKRAAAIANAYVEELGKVAAGLSMAGAGKNRVFLEDRLATAKADLLSAEDAMKAFQYKYKAVSVTDQAKASIEGVAQLRGQLAAQEVQLGGLQRQFTDTSQEVKTARATVVNIKKQIERLEGSGGNSSIPSVGSVPQLGQEYVRLLREFKIQETLVELLTKQYEMVKISEAKDVSPFQVLQKAKEPERKSGPHRKDIVLLVVVAVGCLMMLLAFMLQMVDQLSPEDRTRLTQLQEGVLGEARPVKKLCAVLMRQRLRGRQGD